MKIIYLHGWGGTKDEAKLKILSKFGDEVKYPVIEYNKNKGLINTVADWLHEPETIIIGTSFGGYIAYYASVFAEKPALLINPAFFLKDGGELRPDGWCHSPKDKHFLISKKDEVLDVRKTLKFINEIKVEEQNVTIYDDLTHQIPLDAFDNAFTEFRNKYFKIYEEENEKMKKYLEEENEKMKKYLEEEIAKKKASSDYSWWTTSNSTIDISMPMKKNRRYKDKLSNVAEIMQEVRVHERACANTTEQQITTETMQQASERELEAIAQEHDRLIDDGLIEF